MKDRTQESAQNQNDNGPLGFFLALAFIALVLLVGNLFTENLYTLKETRQEWLGPNWGGPQGLLGTLICIVAYLFHIAFFYVPWFISIIALLGSLYLARRIWSSR